LVQISRRDPIIRIGYMRKSSSRIYFSIFNRGQTLEWDQRDDAWNP